MSPKDPIRLVFLGSGPFAVPVLERLALQRGRVEIARILTRPDRPLGRGRKLGPTPVKARAAELGIPCDSPPSANDPALVAELAALRADLFIVADYGEMLRKAIREASRLGTFNLHASVLPRHRGAAPVAHAILAGDRVTGVTIFRIEAGLDSGPVVATAELAIAEEETAGELEVRLSVLAADLLELSLEPLTSGALPETPQDERCATMAPKLSKGLGAIDWTLEPDRLRDFVRALNPWPCAHAFLARPGKPPERTVFLRVRPAQGSPRLDLPPGSVDEVRRDGFRVRAGGGSVEVLELQREGGAALDAAAYLRGRPLATGDSFSL